MIPLCPLILLCPCQGLGFLVPLLTVPSVVFSPSFAFPFLSIIPTLPLLLSTPFTMSSTSNASSTNTAVPPVAAPSTTPRIPTIPLSSVFPQAVLENGYDHLRDQFLNNGYMYYGSQVSGFEPTYSQVWGCDRNSVVLNSCPVFSLQDGLPLFSDPRVVERVFDYIGGHINDQSDLQSARY